MKELTLQDIQKESLRILRSVHRFCEDNNIRYSLAYGTMIGAARHKGFIPWDNDIDIYMPRPDYEKFCNSFQADGLNIISEKDDECYINFCRVYDIERTIAKVHFPSSEYYNGGLWIDVFPMDGAPDDYEAFLAKMKYLRKFFVRQLYLRKSLGGRKAIKEAFGFKEACTLALCHYLLPTRLCLKAVNRHLRKGAQEFPFGTTGHWTDYCCIFIGDNNFHLTEEWDDIIDVEFEGEQFKMLSAYDSILRRRYGDYMQLPPENARVPKGNDKFYWKND